MDLDNGFVVRFPCFDFPSISLYILLMLKTAIGALIGWRGFIVRILWIGIVAGVKSRE